MNNIESTIAVIIVRMGPYHLCRLKALSQLAEKHNFKVQGIEVLTRDVTYNWDIINSSDNTQHTTLFPDLGSNLPSRSEVSQAVLSKLNELQPKAVLIGGWVTSASLTALAWCRANGRTAIVMSDTWEKDFPRFQIKEGIKKRIIQLFDSALVAGAPQAEYIHTMGISKDRVFTGYDVVDNDYFSTQSQCAKSNDSALRKKLDLPEKYFICVARFTPEKNLPLMLEAYALYRKQMGKDSWSLIVCGAGAEEKTIKQIEQVNNIDGVKYPGFLQIEKLTTYYGLASAMILPSIKDSWGLSVNEAMASGLPVLVSEQCGCAQDLVANGCNGWTFNPNSIQAMAQAMSQMSKLNDAQLTAMGESSKEIIHKWAPDRFATNAWNSFLAGEKNSAQRTHGLSIMEKLLLKIPMPNTPI